jgi:hypothetical protein
MGRAFHPAVVQKIVSHQVSPRSPGHEEASEHPRQCNTTTVPNAPTPP